MIIDTDGGCCLLKDNGFDGWLPVYGSEQRKVDKSEQGWEWIVMINLMSTLDQSWGLFYIKL